MRIKRKSKLCHGCRACQTMCSFHHHRIMAPERSSIRVTRNNADGRVRWTVDKTCDLCERETEPFCIKYCPYGALEKPSS